MFTVNSVTLWLRDEKLRKYATSKWSNSVSKLRLANERWHFLLKRQYVHCICANLLGVKRPLKGAKSSVGKTALWHCKGPHFILYLVGMHKQWSNSESTFCWLSTGTMCVIEIIQTYLLTQRLTYWLNYNLHVELLTEKSVRQQHITPNQLTDVNLLYLLQ